MWGARVYEPDVLRRAATIGEYHFLRNLYGILAERREPSGVFGCGTCGVRGATNRTSCAVPLLLVSTTS
jgi:hypothetical protein